MKQFIAPAFLLFYFSAQAGVIKETPLIQVFKNNECQTANCDLQEFKLHTYNYKVTFADGTSFGTGAYMSYKTNDVSTLEDYAVVQFIKGCVFDSRVLPSGEIQKELAVSREFFGKVVRFKHPEWVIDSLDVDPMYNNGPAGHRHGTYRWNIVANSYDKKTEIKYYNQRPTDPSLYVSDFPSTAFSFDGGARNVSLKFKTCIYPTSDLPLVSGPNDLNPESAVHCFEWKSSNIYNHSKNKYESNEEIDSFCN